MLDPRIGLFPLHGDSTPCVGGEGRRDQRISALASAPFDDAFDYYVRFVVLVVLNVEGYALQVGGKEEQG